MTEKTSGVRLNLARTGDTAKVDAAIVLGNQARATLGYLPFAAYREATAKEELLLALDGGEAVVAYALFDLTVRHVRLVHLCVDVSHRGQGIARQLVEWISDRHRDRAGIEVWCRRDYNLGPMWSRLGFRRLEERRGRGREGRPLVAWWRDHGHPTLFAAPREGVIVRASVDLNVVRDMVEEHRTDREESLALLDDQVVDRLELVRTPSLDLEIEAMNEELRKRCAHQAAALPAVESPAAARRSNEALLRAAADAIDPAFAADPRGQTDIRYVSEALAAGLDVFVTRDDDLSRVLGEGAATHGLRILRPAEVIVRLNELVDAAAYRPGAVQATAFTRQLIPSGSDRYIDAFASLGEGLSTLRARVRSLTARGLERVGIFDPAGKLACVYMLSTNGTVLSVPLLRVREGPYAPTILRQVLFSLRREAMGRGAALLRLDDPHLARATIAAASDDGFSPVGGSFYAHVVDVCGSASQVSEAAVMAARSASLEPPSTLRAELAALAAAEVERVWWPAKLIDSRLPSYIIPIQQTYSHELLGAPPGLFARPATLGLSREHVYYRSPRGLKLKAPARLLWYMSKSAAGSVEPSAVIASSLLEEVVEDTPGRLHDRFRHLGVWRLEQIASVAFHDTAQALRFTHTETFDRPVTGKNLRRVVGQPPQGPRTINSEAFGELYREARRNG